MIDPVQPVAGAAWCALQRQPGQLHRRQYPVGLGDRGGAAVVGQGHPGSQRRIVGTDRVVGLVPAAMPEPAL